jgi:hypothetical protein
MRFLLISLVVCGATFGADPDAWSKVRDLPGGAELRVYRHGAKQPLLVKMDEATADRLLVVLKNEQISIPKEQIDRVDARPSGSRVVRETKQKTSDPSAKVVVPNHPDGANVPGVDSTSHVTFQGKADFETVYRK